MTVEHARAYAALLRKAVINNIDEPYALRAKVVLVLDAEVGRLQAEAKGGSCETCDNIDHGQRSCEEPLCDMTGSTARAVSFSCPR